MKQLNHIHKNMETLRDFLSTQTGLNSEKTLLQLFSGLIDDQLIKDIITVIKEYAPKINIIGATTYGGEIIDGKMENGSILLSFSIFENTTVKTFYTNDSSIESGVNIAEQYLINNAKCAIIFSEAFKTNATSFIRGLQAENSSVIIAGGNAADNNVYIKTLVVHDNEVYDNGLVGAVLYSDSLIINNNYALNWKPFGKSFRITKAVNNKVMELDNKPVIEFIETYFGHEAAENLPASIVEFPFF